MEGTDFGSYFPDEDPPKPPPRVSLAPPRKRRLLLPDSSKKDAGRTLEDTIDDFDSPGRKRKIRLPEELDLPFNEGQGAFEQGQSDIQRPEPRYQDHGVDCVRVSDVFENTQYQSVFPYAQFNAMQSQCFLHAYRTDENLVVSAPTGGGIPSCFFVFASKGSTDPIQGKTVIFELAICRIFSQLNGPRAPRKVLYVAPLKALVQERKEDWDKKFQRAGLTCAELTSDTSEGLASDQIRTSEILLCTPEKWDQLTRTNNASDLVSNISVVLIDEVHILSESRGACLEAIVTRMKLWSHRNLQEGKMGIRFIAVSATAPNLYDIGNWLGAPPDTGVKIFGNEYRPVPLNVIIERVQEAKNQFLWDRNLKFRLLSTIQKYSDSRPTLVFCSSRKSASDAALQIISDSVQGFIVSPSQAQALRSAQVKDKSLGECLRHGIAFYHAALDLEDRRIVQNLFLSGHLRVVCSTSGLAMGVNLPAHLVVICGTKFYRSSSYVDIDSITIMQMIGRAGRPQFDSSGVAIVLTDASGDKKYRNMIEGQETIESSLHHSLAEHFNSEVVLRTIRTMEDAVAWVKSTFLFVRLQLRPEFYQDKLSENLSEEKLEEWVRFVLDDMRAHSLIIQSNGELFATKLGKTLCIHRTNYATMKLFSQLDEGSDFYSTFRVLCSATEFENVVLRRGEKRALNELNKNEKIVKFSIGKLVRDSVDKVCILFQAFFSGHKFDDWSLRSEAGGLLPPSLRIIRCMITFFEEKKFGAPLLHAIRLSQCLDSHMWYDSTLVCRQLEGIGAALANNLMQGNIVSFSELEAANPRKIESLLKRNPPAGNLLQANLQKIWPKLLLTIQVAIVNGTVEMIVSVQSENLSDCERHKFRGKFSRVLVLHERKKLLLFTSRTKNFSPRSSTFKTNFPLSAIEEDPEVMVYALNENYVGMDVSQVIHLTESGGPLSESDVVDKPSTRGVRNDQKETPEGLCKHLCKHKDKCKHPCCKKWIGAFTPTPSVEKRPEPKNKELDLLRKKVCLIPTAEETITHLATSDPPPDVPEISQQISNYREEINFLTRCDSLSPPPTHKPAEMFVEGAEHHRPGQPLYPRKRRCTPQNTLQKSLEAYYNKKTPAAEIFSRASGMGQPQNYHVAPPNERPPSLLSRNSQPQPNLPHLSQYMQQKQQQKLPQNAPLHLAGRDMDNSTGGCLGMSPQMRSPALSKYCAQLSRAPQHVPSPQFCDPPPNWRQSGLYFRENQDWREPGMERDAPSFYDGQNPWAPESGSSRGTPGGQRDSGIAWADRRWSYRKEMVPPPNLLQPLPQTEAREGMEGGCDVSHEKQTGNFCSECGKRLR